MHTSDSTRCPFPRSVTSFAPDGEPGVEVDALCAAERPDVSGGFDEHCDLWRGVVGGARACAMDEPVPEGKCLPQLRPAADNLRQRGHVPRLDNLGLPQLLVLVKPMRARELHPSLISAR